MNKGFTLIELLAVIVILAIIALIATPIVLNIIEDTKTSPTLRSVNNILKGSELYVSKSLMNKESLNGNIYDEIMKTIDGENPDRGNIYANNKGKVAFSFKYNNYCYTKGYEDTEIKVEKTDTCIAPIDYLMEQNQTNGEGEPFFGGNIARSTIEKIYTIATNKVPSGVIDSWDVSETQNGSIMAWYVDEDNNGLYELYLGQEGGKKANPNSKKLFNYFRNTVEIDLSNLDTSNVTNMNAMFQACQNLTKLDITRFNTSNVLDMAFMFNSCNNLASLDLSNFDTSKVTTYSDMFKSLTVSNVIVKDNNAKTFIEARLTDAGLSGTVTIVAS